MLILPIKKKWFDMIRSGEKKEEYREIKPYYFSRFKTLPLYEFREDKMTFEVVFRNGYSKSSPELKCKCKIRIGQGKEEWGAEKRKRILYFRNIGGARAMTNEQRGAIYRLGIHSEYAGLSNGAVVVNKIDLDTVLSLIKEQQEEIVKLKVNLAKSCADRTLDRETLKNQENENLEALHRAYNEELDKKNKQIDLMAEVIFKRFTAELVIEYGIENKEQFIKLFEEKARTNY